MSQLVINGLSHQFGAFEVLEDINLTIPRGSYTCILGPSGCGKTVLLWLLAGFLEPTSGKLQLGRELIREPSSRRAIMFQERALYPWKSVRDNIRIATDHLMLLGTEKIHRVDTVLDFVGLTKFATWPTHKLSGGMKQRVALARGLVTEPDLLLLDEPLVGLDHFTWENLARLLERTWQTRRFTVMHVTHNIDEALTLADQIVVLTARPGKIKKIIPNLLPRPRTPTSADYLALKSTLLELLRHEFHQSAQDQLREGYSSPIAKYQETI